MGFSPEVAFDAKVASLPPPEVEVCDANVFDANRDKREPPVEADKELGVIAIQNRLGFFAVAAGGQLTFADVEESELRMALAVGGADDVVTHVVEGIAGGPPRESSHRVNRLSGRANKAYEVSPDDRSRRIRSVERGLNL